MHQFCSATRCVFCMNFYLFRGRVFSGDHPPWAGIGLPDREDPTARPARRPTRSSWWATAQWSLSKMGSCGGDGSERQRDTVCRTPLSTTANNGRLNLVESNSTQKQVELGRPHLFLNFTAAVCLRLCAVLFPLSPSQCPPTQWVPLLQSTIWESVCLPLSLSASLSLPASLPLCFPRLFHVCVFPTCVCECIWGDQPAGRSKENKMTACPPLCCAVLPINGWEKLERELICSARGFPRHQLPNLHFSPASPLLPFASPPLSFASPSPLPSPRRLPAFLNTSH